MTQAERTEATKKQPDVPTASVNPGFGLGLRSGGGGGGSSGSGSRASDGTMKC